MAKPQSVADRDAMNELLGEVNAQRYRFGYLTHQSLGSAIGVCQASASEYLRRPEIIRIGILRRMVKVLKLDPVIVLKALGYTSKEIKNLASKESV